MRLLLLSTLALTALAETKVAGGAFLGAGGEQLHRARATPVDLSPSAVPVEVDRTLGMGVYKDKFLETKMGSLADFEDIDKEKKGELNGGVR